ncbi:MAG: hypothetical protein PWP33_1343 [Thermodesulfobacterium sp.]|nr:hypothetical protein [Thermodesulfobacterium sp.]
MKDRIDKIGIVVLLVGFVLRLFEFWSIELISRDSPLYLYQAMVLATGNLNLLDLCGLSSRIKEINLFSVAIVPFYYLFRDWEVAGKLVSFVSSSLSLVLLYSIMRRVFKAPILYLVLLAYSFNPTLIKESAEVMRESFFTFLVLLGVWFFIKGYQESSKKKVILFVLANLFWVLSSWVRIEGVFLIGLTFLYLLFCFIFGKDKKSALNTLVSFSIIPFILLLVGIGYVSFYKGFFLVELKGKLSCLNPFEQPFAKELKNFRYLDIPMPSPYFWDILKQNLWLIAFGTTFFYKFIPALHFPIFLLFLAGFKNLRSFLKENPLTTYFLVVSVGYFVGLWYFTFAKWYMEKRYMLPLLYFVSPIVGLGILNVKAFLERRFRLSSTKIIGLLMAYIIIFSGIKVFQPERVDKLGIKQVALDIARSLPEEELKVCSEKACKNLVFTREGRILFYVSNYKKVPLCPAIEWRDFYVKLGKKPVDEVVNYITSKGYKFAILEREIFKENTFVLKQRLESSGIKVYVL